MDMSFINESALNNFIQLFGRLSLESIARTSRFGDSSFWETVGSTDMPRPEKAGMLGWLASVSGTAQIQVVCLHTASNLHQSY